MDKKKYVVISVESGKVSEIEKAMNEFYDDGYVLKHFIVEATEGGAWYTAVMELAEEG